MSLVARHLESVGIPTVVIGSARDIVEECGVPRFIFTDLPLGNPIGPPNDRAAQAETVRLALRLAETAIAPRTTVQAPTSWPDDEWRASYMLVNDKNRSQLLAAGEQRRRDQRRKRQP